MVFVVVSDIVPETTHAPEPEVRAQPRRVAVPHVCFPAQLYRALLESDDAHGSAGQRQQALRVLSVCLSVTPPSPGERVTQ